MKNKIYRLESELNGLEARIDSFGLEKRRLNNRLRACEASGAEFTGEARMKQVEFELKWANEEVRRVQAAIRMLTHKRRW